MTRDPAARDALALMACELRGDEAGAAVILDDCDLREVVKFLAGFGAAALRRASGNAPNDALAQLAGEHLLRLENELAMNPIHRYFHGCGALHET